MGTNTRHFKLDSSTPLRQQAGERASAYRLFLRWKELDWCSDEELAEDSGKVSAGTVQRYRAGFKWAERRGLYLARQNESPESRMYAPQETKEPKVTLKKSRRSDANIKSSGEVVMDPPPPVERGLIPFALRYGRAIVPGGLKMDALMECFLTELEAWVEGEQNFIQISPHPRSGKSLAAVLAMAYSYLRYPTRHQILISASGRLSALQNQNLRTVIEYALPAGYGLAKDSKSKLAFKGDWLGAGLNYSASRGGQLMGLTGNRILCDDLVSSTLEVESPDVMAAATRTMTTDLFTRLTADSYGKGSGICFIAQRISNTDLVAEMVRREKENEDQGLTTTPWTVIAAPFYNPTDEEKARIVDSYPASWQIKFPRFGQVGDPVCDRFTKEFAETLKANMNPADWASMYELNTANDEYCAWREHYLQPIEDDDIRITTTVMYCDLNLAGADKGADKSAVAIGGVQDGNVVILGLHFLQGEVEHQLAQIVELAEKYNCFVVFVEKAAAGHFVLKSLNNRIGDKTFQVRAASHKGLNKGARLNQILGPCANKKIWIKKGLELTPVLQQQLKVIAVTKGRTHKKDDLGDCTVGLIDSCWNHYVKSGFNTTGVTWQGGVGNSGVTECTWGRGVPTTRQGLDGVERYNVWD